MKIKGSNVLITGGASGIGKIMGRMALEKGARNLIIWDINIAAIEAVKQEFKELGNVYGYRVDVSSNDTVVNTYKRVLEDCGEVDILINCAGIVTSNKTFDQMSADEITRTININTIAPMFVAHAMLPGMLRRNRGHICTITSAGGMLSNPKMSVYAASKWGATGWSDSVRIELQEMKSKVRITTVAPYYINTGMFDGVKSPIIPILKPEYVSRKVLRAIEKNKNFAGIPFGFHFIRFWQAFLPTRVFDFFFGKVFGIYHAMDQFTGRTKQEKGKAIA
ncbi:MAG: SDR family oxidoreductase [Bacteroidales bacterium]|nr:SDR family oxidoreductase [Bacteroidales bacterium]